MVRKYCTHGQKSMIQKQDKTCQSNKYRARGILDASKTARSEHRLIGVRRPSTSKAFGMSIPTNRQNIQEFNNNLPKANITSTGQQVHLE